MLTEEQRILRELANKHIDNPKLSMQLLAVANSLAAHYAETQEPVAWRVSGTYTSGLHFSHLYDEKVTAEKSAASAAMRTLTPLYAHPQPITDAARDVLIERAQRLLEGATWNLGGVLSSQSKVSDIPSRASSAVKSRHLASLRDALAEIERLDRAKGE